MPVLKVTKYVPAFVGMSGPPAAPIPPGKSDAPQFTSQASFALNLDTPSVSVIILLHKYGLAASDVKSVSASQPPGVEVPRIPSFGYGVDRFAGMNESGTEQPSAQELIGAVRELISLMGQGGISELGEFAVGRGNENADELNTDFAFI